ncbi:MAG: GerMN domain-containing protein [Treponema sp.]|nr:GerMN domain-containing protein [Treponema sp.]
MANKKSKKKKNSNLLGFALVALCLLLILIIFMVNKDTIISNLKVTKFFDKIFGSTPEFVEKHEVLPQKDSNESVNDTVTLKLLTPQKENSPLEDSQSSSEPLSPQVEEETLPEQKEAQEIKQEAKEEKNVEKTVEKPKEEKKVSAKTELQVCFVYVDPDGSVIRKIVKKSVAKNDSPLVTSINLLLQGPDTSKREEKDCMTLIPQGSKLLSARVSDGVAYLSFNEDFMVNSYGVDGYRNQLMQIVYTATAFSTVSSVQFLIEGEVVPYLSEGIWIGSPLSRGSF